MIGALSEATIGIPGPYVEAARYRYDSASPAPYAVERDPFVYDSYSACLFLRPPYEIGGRRFRVRAFGVRTADEVPSEVTLAIAAEVETEGQSSITLADSGGLATYCTPTNGDGIDLPWHEFAAVPSGEGWNGLAVYTPSPSLGARIEWQVWQAETTKPDRKVMVRASKDGGHNWGPWRESSLGELGQYQHRVRFRRFGRGSQFCFQVRVTSPLVMDHLGGVADMEAGE